MKVFISADIEGISGVVAGVQTSDDEKEFERARRLMTGEVNAAIAGAFGAGASEVLVNDSHGAMRNIMIEELDVRAELVTGSPKPFSMMEGLDERFDVALFVGYHAMAGNPLGTLNHTYSGRHVFELKLNGQPVGEVGLNAALAGALGVPVGLVTGDLAVVAEAQTLLAPPATVAVKRAVGRSAARCLPPSVARQRIEAAASEAVRRRGQPYVLTPPIIADVTFMRTDQADMAALLPDVERLDGRTVRYQHEDMRVLFRVWRALLALAAYVN
ncbi:MAG TPA: M55 family metallopeptidase [Anaerolineae bacterium]|nr:M55 family metallopeptidase [Anaerolineae bacterium]